MVFGDDVEENSLIVKQTFCAKSYRRLYIYLELKVLLVSDIKVEFKLAELPIWACGVLLSVTAVIRGLNPGRGGEI